MRCNDYLSFQFVVALQVLPEQRSTWQLGYNVLLGEGHRE